MSKHRAIAQSKMADMRRQIQQSLRHLRKCTPNFRELHERDLVHAQTRFAAYFMASDAMPPLTTQGIIY
jgi:hypothetical protein